MVIISPLLLQVVPPSLCHCGMSSENHSGGERKNANLGSSENWSWTSRAHSHEVPQRMWNESADIYTVLDPALCGLVLLLHFCLLAYLNLEFNLAFSW